jgi:hypothetical protein
MTLGLTIPQFTLLHVLISLLGMGSGFAVMFGLISGKILRRWTAWFLGTTVATSATGFLFPFERLLPSHIVGAISLVVLVVAIMALYAFHPGGPWRTCFVISASLALYFNVFVGVVQGFQKIPTLKALAPTQSELPFAIAQLAALAAFAALTAIAVKNFRAAPTRIILCTGNSNGNRGRRQVTRSGVS